MAATRYLQRIDRGIAGLESFILAAGVLALAAVSITNTLLRNVRGTTLPGASELTEILMIWITFGGLAYAVRHARHIAMTAVYDQLRGRLRKGLSLLVSSGTALLLGYLGLYATLYVIDVYQGGRVTTALNIPVWIGYLIVPIGLWLAALQYALTTWRNLSSAELYRSFTERERYEEVTPRSGCDDGGHDPRSHGANGRGVNGGSSRKAPPADSDEDRPR
ncbi:hypothetical protein CKO15_03955 [Halorhodospira abdelmalekii]|uniref:TRAP transporter small permease n=1 Tax=Halorhodospira abdelmalekii TaxID=421629 RepID=UPI0019030C50|nr:TRAP transporter small permease [Halorhodospira abdelmalekii]MBK1734452.1 hypothetical protein [Halorhodospira abdelmalekii]